MKVSNDRTAAMLRARIAELLRKPNSPAVAIELQATQNLLELVEVLIENQLPIRDVTETFRSTRRPLPGEQQRLGL